MGEQRKSLDDLREKRGGLRTQLEETQVDLDDNRSLLVEESSDDMEAVLADLDRLQVRSPGRGRLQSAFHRGAPARVPRVSASRHRPGGQAYRAAAVAHRRAHERFPQPLAAGESSEFDAAVEAGHEYREMLERLQADDLPAFEERFKALLNENTIREVTTFQAELHRQRNRIGERIETINRSLHEIDYEKSRYIHLLAESAPDSEIREFIQDLRSCTEGTSTGGGKRSVLRAEVHAGQGHHPSVCAVAKGLTELDRRWTRKVTDVRNWYVFFGLRALAR